MQPEFTFDVTVPMDYGQFYMRTGSGETADLDAAPLVDVALARIRRGARLLIFNLKVDLAERVAWVGGMGS